MSTTYAPDVIWNMTVLHALHHVTPAQWEVLHGLYLDGVTAEEAVEMFGYIATLDLTPPPSRYTSHYHEEN